MVKPWARRRPTRRVKTGQTLKAPLQLQRRPRLFTALNWPDYLLLAQIDYAQAIAEIRALLGWLMEGGCPAVAVWGGSYGGALSGLMACYEPRLAAAVLAVPGLDPLRL